MAWLWSDPTPSNATSAALSAPYKVDAASIGAVVAAILGSRARQAELQQQQVEDAQKAYGQFSQQQQLGQADDAANAAIYGFNYPSDAASAYSDPGRVPDYGGMAGLKAMQAQSALQTHDLQQELAQQRINAIKQKLEGGDGGEEDYGPETTWDNQGREWRKGSGGHWYLIKGAADSSKRDLDAEIRALNQSGGLSGGAKISEGTFNAPDQWHAGTGPQGEYIPEGYYGVGRDKLQTVVPQEQADRARTAYDRFVNRGTDSSVRQSDVAQAREAIAPPPAAIDYLRAHPELRKAFEDKYGISADQYLR